MPPFVFRSTHRTPHGLVVNASILCLSITALLRSTISFFLASDLQVFQFPSVSFLSVDAAFDLVIYATQQITVWGMRLPCQNLTALSTVTSAESRSTVIQRFEHVVIIQEVMMSWGKQHRSHSVLGLSLCCMIQTSHTSGACLARVLCPSNLRMGLNVGLRDPWKQSSQGPQQASQMQILARQSSRDHPPSPRYLDPAQTASAEGSESLRASALRTQKASFEGSFGFRIQSGARARRESRR